MIELRFLAQFKKKYKIQNKGKKKIQFHIKQFSFYF